ncbi:hypothetical protein GCM10022377_10120 [Zhihengliuella alba]|uniref:Capsid maturation protease n=1 Tax=Zhihengliuella alba TaxID=547018 RepID=A0ABP7D439_9MICC
MTIPAPAVDHYKQMQRLQSLGKLQARRAWSQVQVGMISPSWELILRNSGLVAAMSALQEEAAVAGASYGAATLAAQGLYEPPQAFVDPTGFAGFASDGRPLDGLMYSAAPHTKRLIGGGMDPQQAKIKGGKFLEMAVGTLIADSGRGAAGVDTATRKGVQYVRMLNPPSCARCVILAGRVYWWNTGFSRHPGCDCVHVQTMHGKAEGATTDPYEYFESLSDKERQKVFTKAGAQAIDDGADIYQVVNSRRGMKPGGLVTYEGTSRRGFYGRGKPPRLTPEAIYRKGLSREETIAELERYGYIVGGGQTPEGAIRGRVDGFGALGRGGTRRGASAEIAEARRTGIRPEGARNSLTAAERRLQDSRLRWEAVQQGRNPYGRWRLTPEQEAQIEYEYRLLNVYGREETKISPRKWFSEE